MLSITSSASPVGSGIFAVFALLFVSLVVLLILRYFLPLRTTPAFYLVPIFFALWLPSVIVLLVPIDLASNATTDDEATRGIWLPERVLLVSWRISYWLTFALTWFILPILGEYSDSGYREPKDKLLYSLRENAQFAAIMLGAGFVGLIYMFWAYGPSVGLLKANVMALAYAWGLVLAIYLMGHGLVSIPRRLMRNASISGRLRRLQTSAPQVHELMEDALARLEEVEAQVSELSRRKTGSAMEFQDWVEELREIANVPEAQQAPSAMRDPMGDARVLPTVITEKFLADLTRRLDRARHTKSRYVNEWTRLVHEANDTQMVLDSAASKKLDFGEPSPHSSPLTRTKFLTPYSRFLLHYHVLPYAQISLGVFLALASVCIVWSELVKSAFPMLSIIRVSVVHHWVGDKAQVGFAGQVISAFWICYMCAATFITMTEIKVWRGRALIKRNTAHESAFWYSMQIAKLSVPLSYNFMTFLSNKVYSKSIFYHFLGEQIDKTAPSRWFDDIFPVLVLFPVFATMFGLYGKVKRLFTGWDMMEDDETNPAGYGTGSWREGRDLIERELGGAAVNRRREDAFARLAAATATNGTTPDGRSAPVLSIPAARGGASSSSPARSPVRGGNRGAAPSSGSGPGSSQAGYADEPEDDNLLQIIGHRMKNTIDTIDTPQWLQEFGSGIKKPKWMGGDDSAGESSRPSGGDRSNSDIRRWFGGGDNGQIRL